MHAYTLHICTTYRHTCIKTNGHRYIQLNTDHFTRCQSKRWFSLRTFNTWSSGWGKTIVNLTINMWHIHSIYYDYVHQAIVKAFFNSLLWIWCQISSEAQQKALPEHRHPAEQILGQTCWLLGKLASEANGSHPFPFRLHRFIPWTFHMRSLKLPDPWARSLKTRDMKLRKHTQHLSPNQRIKINPQRNAAVSASLNRFLQQVLLAEPGLLTWHVALGCDCMERGTGGTWSFGGAGHQRKGGVKASRDWQKLASGRKSKVCKSVKKVWWLHIL